MIMDKKGEGDEVVLFAVSRCAVELEGMDCR
jgi:hypothetical protein